MNRKSVKIIQCHCCDIIIYGCSGSVSWPEGLPFETPPEFHCPKCTEKHLSLGGPCYTRRVNLDQMV